MPVNIWREDDDVEMDAGAGAWWMIDDGAKPCPSGASARVAAANRDLTILQNWISIAIYLSANEVLLIISVTKLLVKEQKILDIMVLTMMLNVDKLK